MRIQPRTESEAIQLAWAICNDASNRSMRKAARTAWNEEDRDAGTDAFYVAMAAFGFPQPH